MDAETNPAGSQAAAQEAAQEALGLALFDAYWTLAANLEKEGGKAGDIIAPAEGDTSATFHAKLGRGRYDCDLGEEVTITVRLGHQEKGGPGAGLMACR
jgi:hypothetical protein